MEWYEEIEVVLKKLGVVVCFKEASVKEGKQQVLSSLYIMIMESLGLTIPEAKECIESRR